MNRQKIPAIKRNATTQQVLENAMLRVGHDAEVIANVKKNALSIFSVTMNNLERVNEECKQTIDQMDQLIAFANSQKQDAERTMTDNNAVMGKIREIIGE